MAEKMLKGINFPGLEDTYMVPQINDTAINAKDVWSSKNTVDKLCPAFEESGDAVFCKPLEDYPLEVITKLPTDRAVSEISMYHENEDGSEAHTVDFGNAYSNGYYNWTTGELHTENEGSIYFEPRTITALSGENILFSDCGDTTVNGKKDLNEYWEEKVGKIIDDTAMLTDSTWSSWQIVKRLCPTFQEKGPMVSCYPVQSSELRVSTVDHKDEDEEVTFYRCGKNLLDYNMIGESGTTKKNVTVTRIWNMLCVKGYVTSPMFINIGEITLPEGWYTYSFNEKNSSDCKNGIAYGQLWSVTKKSDGSDKLDSLATYVGYTQTSKAFYLDKETKIRARVYIRTVDTDFLTYIQPQIEVGQIATSAVPYDGATYTKIVNKGVYGNVCNFYATNGVNNLYCIPSRKLCIDGYSDPAKVIEKLTNAIIALGGNI